MHASTHSSAQSVVLAGPKNVVCCSPEPCLTPTQATCLAKCTCSVCTASCKGKYLSSKYIINGLSFDIYTFPMLVCLCVRMQDLDTHLIFRCDDFVLCPPALNVFLLDYSRAILVGNAQIILVVLSWKG